MQSEDKKSIFTAGFANMMAQARATALQDILAVGDIMTAIQYKAPRYQKPSRLYQVRNKGSGKGAKRARLREIARDDFLDRLYAETIVDETPSRQVRRRAEIQTRKEMGFRIYRGPRGFKIVTNAQGKRGAGA